MDLPEKANEVARLAREYGKDMNHPIHHDHPDGPTFQDLARGDVPEDFEKTLDAWMTLFEIGPS